MNTSRVSDELENVTGQIKEGVRKGRFALEDIQQAVVDRTRSAAKETDHYVHEHPWSIIGAAVGLGLIVGLLLHRR